jgi:hypothetical protein
MLTILHRRNTLAELAATDRNFGVEVDIHAFGSKLTVYHDALAEGEDFERWLDAYNHGFVIFNVKEEGVEQAVVDLAAERGIVDYFLLDMSFPALIKMTRKNESRIAVRVSEYEPIEGALRMAGKVAWVWLDIFESFSLTTEDNIRLHEAGMKICLVSPELHGRSAQEIVTIRNRIATYDLKLDAVCTKQPQLWNSPL